MGLFHEKEPCHNSWDKFHQEYPAAADLAFLFTGMPWFDHDAIRDLLDRVCSAPVHRGYLKFVEAGSTDPQLAEDPHGPLSIWKPPEAGLTYSLGMDVGEGVGADYTVIQVICNENGEAVARYASNRVRARLPAWMLISWELITTLAFWVLNATARLGDPGGVRTRYGRLSTDHRLPEPLLPHIY